MNGNLEMLTRIAAVMLGIVALLVTAVLIYAAYLVSKLQRLVDRLLRRPQVERDHTGAGSRSEFEPLARLLR